MSKRTQVLNQHPAAIVEFSYDTQGGTTISQRVVVPENLLWYADGLRYMFEACRAAILIGPGGEGFDETAWDSWHLAGIPHREEELSYVAGIAGAPPFPRMKQYD